MKEALRLHRADHFGDDLPCGRPLVVSITVDTDDLSHLPQPRTKAQWGSILACWRLHAFNRRGDCRPKTTRPSQAA